MAGTAILNQVQVDVYAGAPWQHSAPDDRVMVMHTLVVDPLAPRCGLGRAMVSFYERYALAQGCPYLRMDTNVKIGTPAGFTRVWAFGRLSRFPAHSTVCPM